MLYKENTLSFLNEMKKGIEEDIMIVKDLEESKVLDYMFEKSNCLTKKGGKNLMNFFN